MIEIKPLIIGNLVHVDNRDIKGIMVRLVNTPGALAEVLSILAKYNVDILAVNFPGMAATGKLGILFIIARLSESDYEKVKSNIYRLDSVENVEIINPQIENFLLVDLYHLPIVDVRGERLLLLTEDNMKSLVVDLRKRFREGGLAFLYHQGLFTGLLLADIYKGWRIKTLETHCKRIF
ncbi:MAG: hypothetical protein DRJ38_01345 [Thermoprotei archaeon]|nr:MAG: hypothetical protein DRJ38_01345 [Thermoprotei archaeon]